MKKRLSALALAAAMTASLTVPALAATEYKYIESLDLNISYSIEAGSDEWDFVVTCDTPGVYFDDYDDVKVTNAPEEDEAWGDNIKPKATIELYADTDDDYRFKGIGKDDVTISGGEISKYTVSDSSKKVTVTVTLPELEYEEGYWEEILQIDDVEWGDYDGTVKWEENEDADHYEFKLYRGSSALTGIVATEYTEADLSQYFTRQGDYRIRVRAVSGKEEGAWVEDEIYVDTEEAKEIRENGGELETGDVSSNTNTNTNTNTSNKNNTTTNNNNANAGGPGVANKPAAAPKLPDYVVTGTWTVNNGVWMFKDGTGTTYKSRWAAVYNPYANAALGQENFDWFYFDQNGHMQTGWVQDGGLWYYCSPISDGTLGKMVTGWSLVGDSYYYFNPVSDGTRGAMLTNTWIGKDYVGADGKFDPNKVR